MWISTQDTRQRGVSTLEASLAIAPVLLVCLLGLELVHAHQVKQLLGLALHEASRRASVTHADRKETDQAFTQALSPLFTPPGQHTTALKRQQATIARFQRLYALPLWQLELTELKNRTATSHERQAVRLDLAYVHEPLQPWLRRTLRSSLHWLRPASDALEDRTQRQGLILMRLTRRVAIHASQTKDTTKRLPKDSEQWKKGLSEPKQMQGSKLERQPNQQKRATRPLSQLSSQLSSQLLRQPSGQPFSQLSEPAPESKASILRSLKHESQHTELCGVLLCCAP